MAVAEEDAKDCYHVQLLPSASKEASPGPRRVSAAGPPPPTSLAALAPVSTSSTPAEEGIPQQPVVVPRAGLALIILAARVPHHHEALRLHLDQEQARTEHYLQYLRDTADQGQPGMTKTETVTGIGIGIGNTTSLSGAEIVFEMSEIAGGSVIVLETEIEIVEEIGIREDGVLIVWVILILVLLSCVVYR
ncbi:hypothetical protein FRC05_004195 [Tulasnella sp. 425]|nr:hypothetical protein FRC05_004195 [Tulasnella sp. 425]